MTKETKQTFTSNQKYIKGIYIKLIVNLNSTY